DVPPRDDDLRRLERGAARDHRQVAVGVLSMDLKLSDQELALRDGLRTWLDANYDFEAHLARTASARTRDDALWREMIDRGWIARALPRRDALDQSTIDAAIIAEEFGRAVVVEPFFRSAFLAANVVFEAAEPTAA